MTRLINLYLRIVHRLEYGLGAFLMPTLARIVFAGLFAVYYWEAASVKLGADFAGLWAPTRAAYDAFLPGVESASNLQTTLVLVGTWAEALLPALILIGFLTRLAAFGMVIFIAATTLAEISAPGTGAATVGAWFDATPTSPIMDQRALWIMLMLILMFRGAGPLSLDGIIKRWLNIY